MLAFAGTVQKSWRSTTKKKFFLLERVGVFYFNPCQRPLAKVASKQGELYEKHG